MAYQPLQTEQEYEDLQPPPYQPGPSGTPIPMQSYCQPHQQQSSNVVVVGQPNQVNEVRVREVRRANDNLIWSILLFLTCICLGNWVLLICLFPALIFSIIASTYNDAGEYDLAKRFGSIACTCNVIATAVTIVIVVIGIIVVVVLLVAVFNVLSF